MLNSWGKTTHILIYRIIDNLINGFPGLGNIYRRGFEKNKLITAFSKLDINDLKNPNYELPGFVEKNHNGTDRKEGKGSLFKAKLTNTSFGEKTITQKNNSKDSVSSNDINSTFIDFSGKKQPPIE